MERKPTVYNGELIPLELSENQLRELLNTPSPKAWAACIALAYHPSEEAFSILQDLLNHADWRYRRTAIEAMGYHNQVTTIPEKMLDCLDDPSPFVVKEALRTINRMKLSFAHDQVIHLTLSKNSDLREEAIRTLEALALPKDFGMLLDRYQNDPSIRVKKVLGWVLKNLATQNNWQDLFFVRKDDPIPRHRVWACEIVGIYDPLSVITELKRLASDPNGHVRKAAMQVLETAQI